jgi:hypothetical protein
LIRQLHSVDIIAHVPFVSYYCILSTFRLDRLNGYSQSKWVSEKLILNAISDGFIRGNISRPGLIGANSKTGHCNKTDWFYQLVRSLHQLGYYPTGPSWDNGGVSIVTVDTVARAVVHLSLGYCKFYCYKCNNCGHVYTSETDGFRKI